jgi:hypothetical protein
VLPFHPHLIQDAITLNKHAKLHASQEKQKARPSPSGSK